MGRRNFEKLIILLTALVVSVYSEVSISEQEEQARALFEQAEKPYEDATKKIKSFFLEGDPDDTIDNMKKTAAENTIRNISDFISMAVQDAPYQQFEDKDLARQIKLSLHRGRHVLPLFNLSDFQLILSTLKSLPGKEFICSHNEEETDCDLSYVPDVLKIFKETDDVKVLDHYWVKWRDNISATAKENLNYYAKWYQHKAVENGFTSPVAYYYSKYEDEDMLDDFTAVMVQLQPIYKQFHAYVRHVLEDEVGSEVVGEDGLISHAIFEQLVAKAWLNDSLLKPPDSDDFSVPNIDENLYDQSYNSRKFVTKADEFYTSLGLASLPDDFTEDNLKEKEQTEQEGDCKEFVYEYRKGAILKYCPDNTYRKFIQMHGVMARIHYAYKRENLSWVFDREACPGFSDALGESSVLLSTTYKYLNRTDVTPDAHYDPLLATSRLHRMLTHTFFTVPLYYIHEKLTVDLISGKLSVDHFNCAYWDLMERFLGVGPPTERTNENIDVSYRFYFGLDSTEKTHTMKLFSEILGYQFYKAFCVMSDQIRENDPEFSLDNCDYTGSKAVGEALTNIMSAGASKSWRDIIEPIVGGRSLDGQAVMDYYEPAIKEIEKYNKKKNVRVGWTPSGKCSRLASE